jgi:integrase
MAQELVAARSMLTSDQLVQAWLAAKTARSAETQRAYARGLDAFRRFLAPLDLDAADPRRVRLTLPLAADAEAQADASETLAAAIALAAQTWAGQGHPADATFNRRLAIVSSFYTYVLRQGLLRGPHPLQRLERRRMQPYAHARALDLADMSARLAAMPRETPDGLRDYTLLVLALHTGRRAMELASLRCGHLNVTTRAITVRWPRLKGGKTLDDTLPLSGPHSIPGKTLRHWLQTCYGTGPYHSDAPVWPSLSRNGSRGHAISPRSIANLCDKWLGMSQVHALRHTFAKTMEDAGAKVSEIQARLGHTSLAVTGRYLARLHHSENRHLGDLSRYYGFTVPADEDDDVNDDAHPEVTRSNT